MAGVPTKFGSDPIFHEVPERDPAMVQRLREAGAVIVGKTSLLEFAYGAVNPRVGQTNNPCNPERTSGARAAGRRRRSLPGSATPRSAPIPPARS